VRKEDDQAQGGSAEVAEARGRADRLAYAPRAGLRREPVAEPERLRKGGGGLRPLERQHKTLNDRREQFPRGERWPLSSAVGLRRFA
jgi:hypothetical protein